MIIRIHLSSDTVDIQIDKPRAAVEAEVERIAIKGTWTTDRTKFYPAKDIVSIEVKD